MRYIGLTLILVAFLESCLYFNFIKDNWNGGLIVKPGIYKIANSDKIIKVIVRDKVLVSFAIEDTKGKIMLKSDETFNIYYKWFLFWDKNEYLWVYNSDNGDCCVWVKQKNSRYSRCNITENENLKNKIPIKFFNILPPDKKIKLRNEINKETV